MLQSGKYEIYFKLEILSVKTIYFIEFVSLQLESLL